MKVLILHQHFKTPQGGGAIRSYYLAQALVAKGVEVEVITGHDNAYQKETVDGVVVHYLKVPYNNSFGFFKRSTSFLKFVWKAVDKARACKGVDLCYAISVPLTVGIAAQRMKRSFNIPFVFEVGDLWPDAPIEMGFVKNGLFKKYLLSMEQSIYKSARSVVALSPAIQSAIERKVPGKTVHMIPNMADTDFFEKTSKEPALVEKFKVKGKFVVSYIGALGVANGVEYILHCADASRKSGLPIHFFICGDGALKSKIEADIEKSELQNVTVMHFTNRDGVKDLLNVTDAAFISYQPIPILETGSPNKFFDALAAGKLVIINFAGWIKNEIEENQCGIFVEPKQPTDFIKKIKPFLEDQLLLESYQFNARSLAEKKYSRKELSDRFLEVILDSIKN